MELVIYETGRRMTDDCSFICVCLRFGGGRRVVFYAHRKKREKGNKTIMTI